MGTESRIGGSFRDPSGYVFEKEGILFRRVSATYLPNYLMLHSTNLLSRLVEENLLIPHEELETTGECRLLKPERVPFISYPWEWSFSMLQDAALLTLKIQKIALRHGMGLKDASAFNIQFVGCKPILIDTLSFEPYVEGVPWIAYGQFCKHFLAPLVLSACVDARLQRMSMLDIDGIPIDLADAMLPLLAKANPTVALHIVSQSKLEHAAARQAAKSTGACNAPLRGASRKVYNVSRTAMEAIIENLEQYVSGLRPAGESKSSWMDYYATCKYTDAASEAKAEAVGRFLSIVSPAMVFDIGANTGYFSRIAAAAGIRTVAMDRDPWCVEGMYRRCRQDDIGNLLPLVQDAANPSPAIGWALKERDSLFARASADLVLSLALIHHLAIGNNVPLPYIADLFSRLGRWLAVEFVPKSDAQVQSLLASREDIFPDYSLESFLAAFQKKYELIERCAIPDSDRELFLFKRL